LPPLPAGMSELDVDADSESYDILDETLTLFRANTLFRNFEIKGPADRVLIYGILWISECLGKVKPGMGQRDAEKVHFRLWFCLRGGPLRSRRVRASENCYGGGWADAFLNRRLLILRRWTISRSLAIRRSR
jgi:hypothetical protein